MWPNPKGPQPNRPQRFNPPAFTLGQISGTLTMIRAANATPTELATFSMRVARANGWNAARPTRRCPPIEHVIYVIKENRTYDQIFGDLPAGDGDTSLLFFPRPVTPNHHALAERFGLFDRFFVNAEVSTDGHNWSTASYATDYVQKTTPSQYSNRGRSYDYTGTNRDSLPEDDIAELEEFKKVGRMPALEIVWLPNDHTAGLRAGSPTPAVYMADNDLALGRWSKRSRKPRFGRPP